MAGKIIQRIEERGIPDPCHEARPFVEGAGRRVLRGTSRATVFWQSDHLHVVRTGHFLVLEASETRSKVAHADGCDRPAKADPGTLRKEFGQSIERNATHGSDAPETAAYEIGYFFGGVELI